jgi:colanic acid biosynthesis glycosyl transferase WcaI
VRILIHGINFAPELVGSGKYTGEMAEWLAAFGHEVRTVTAPPFNPAWKVAPGYSQWRYTREDYFPQKLTESCGQALAAVVTGAPMLHSVRPTLPHKQAPEPETHRAKTATCEQAMFLGSLVVFRCPLWVSQHPSAARRLLHLASFALCSSPVMLRQVAWKPDVVIVIEPALFCAPAAWMTGRLSGAKTWLHIQDFEIDAAFEMGLLHSKSLQRVVNWFEKVGMSGFDRISTISEKMLTRLPPKGVTPARCVLFENWVDTSTIFPLGEPSPLRKEFGIPFDDVVALYSGTMGQKQGLEVLAETARLLQPKKRLWFVFCGEGPGKAGLVRLTSEFGNVLFFPLQPFEKLNDLLNLADIHLLPQRADAADLVMPSKLTGILASGRPVIATAHDGTQLAQVVEGKGLVVPPGDPAALSAAILKLLDEPNLRHTLGQNARKYAVCELDKNRVLFRFEEQLQLCANSRSRH